MITCTDDWMRVILSFIWEFTYKVGVYFHAYETKCYVSWWKFYLNEWIWKWAVKNRMIIFFRCNRVEFRVLQYRFICFQYKYMNTKYYHLIYTVDVIKSKLFWKTSFECVCVWKNKCWNFEHLFSFLFSRLSQDSRVSFRLITKLSDHSILYK